LRCPKLPLDEVGGKIRVEKKGERHESCQCTEGAGAITNGRARSEKDLIKKRSCEKHNDSGTERHQTKYE